MKRAFTTRSWSRVFDYTLHNLRGRRVVFVPLATRRWSGTVPEHLRERETQDGRGGSVLHGAVFVQLVKELTLARIIELVEEGTGLSRAVEHMADLRVPELELVAGAFELDS